VAEVPEESLPEDILSLMPCAPHRLPLDPWCVFRNALWWSRYSMAPEGEVGVAEWADCQSFLSA
jgi:hypothetical protein